jgi:hypothetical protein
VEHNGNEKTVFQVPMFTSVNSTHAFWSSYCIRSHLYHRDQFLPSNHRRWPDVDGFTTKTWTAGSDSYVIYFSTMYRYCIIFSLYRLVVLSTGLLPPTKGQPLKGLPSQSESRTNAPLQRPRTPLIFLVNELIFHMLHACKTNPRYAKARTLKCIYS